MKLPKNLEALFLVTVALSFSAAAIAAPAPARVASAPTATSNAKMIKVVIKGKRLTAAQKAQLAG